MCNSNMLGTKVVIFSTLIGLLLANTLDDGSTKIAGSAFLIIGLTLYTMSYGCNILDPVKPGCIDKCYGPTPYYPDGCYQL